MSTNEDDKLLASTFLKVIGAILLLAAILCVSYYVNHKIQVDNFQATIQDLSDEQKCIHICGFEWHGYFENYKFCMEKCDRISERTLSQSSG